MNQNTKYVDPWRTDEDLAMNPVPIGGACISVTHTKAHRRIMPRTLHRQVGLAWDGGSRISGTKGVSLLDGNNYWGGLASLYLLLPFVPQTVPSILPFTLPKPRFIFLDNFSAFSSLPVHAPPPLSDTMDPKGMLWHLRCLAIRT